MAVARASFQFSLSPEDRLRAENACRLESIGGDRPKIKIYRERFFSSPSPYTHWAIHSVTQSTREINKIRRPWPKRRCDDENWTVSCKFSICVNHGNKGGRRNRLLDVVAGFSSVTLRSGADIDQLWSRNREMDRTLDTKPWTRHQHDSAFSRLLSAASIPFWIFFR
jgi:hypothetical protein